MGKGELTLEKEILKKGKWEEITLSKVAKFRPSKTQVRDLSNLNCSFVPMKDLNEKEIEFIPKEERKIGDVYKGYTYFENNDVLLAKVTPCFQNRKAGVAKDLVNGIGFGSSEFFVFRPSEKILPEFIYYFFMTEEFINKGVANMSGAVGLRRVTNDYVKNVKIPLPPLSEQRRILSKLDTLFAEIDASLALIDQNIAQAEALKLSVLDEEFGKIRKEENIFKIKDLAFTKSGATPRRSIKSYWGGNIPWLKSGELNDNKNIVENLEYITQKGLENSSAKIFPKGTLLMAMYGATAGKLGILGIEACTNQAVCSIQNDKGLFIEEYLYYYLLMIREKIILDSFGGAQPNISKRYIDNLDVPLPVKKERQQKIVQKLDALFAEIDALVLDYTQKRENLEALKSSLLDQAFKGEL
ncbi:MAG TPA: restriction endonuclease subunit S [Flavobacteriaceae bacterium]|nr:restriction endonuclease subunit S [Flavobacteriaceae bacterium]